MTGLSDSFQRPINYLRVSVTDRCNLRCLYCMPPEGIPLLPREEVLSYEEITAVVAAAAGLGISKVRLTGGEPLVRTGLVSLVRSLASLKGVDDLSLTTNGVLLKRFASSLKEAGLRRVNVSLDTLRRGRFREITGRDCLRQVLEGLEAARDAGLKPVKVNTVVLRGRNDDEVLDFARRSLEEGWHVRFIELMPLGRGQAFAYVPIAEIRERLEALAPLEPCLPEAGGGPAKYFRYPGAKGTVGFISPVSECFCAECNRLRLTAEGKLRLCLLHDQEIDLRPALRNGASQEELQALLKEAVAFKPEQHLLAQGALPGAGSMAQIGG